MKDNYIVLYNITFLRENIGPNVTSVAHSMTVVNVLLCNWYDNWKENVYRNYMEKQEMPIQNLARFSVLPFIFQ